MTCDDVIVDCRFEEEDLKDALPVVQKMSIDFASLKALTTALPDGELAREFSRKIPPIIITMMSSNLIHPRQDETHHGTQLYR